MKELLSQWSFPTIPIEVKLNLNAQCYKKTRARCDLANVVQGTQDALQEAGIITDDWQICGLDGSRVKYDSENPRVEIELTLMKEQEDGKDR